MSGIGEVIAVGRRAGAEGVVEESGEEEGGGDQCEGGDLVDSGAGGVLVRVRREQSGAFVAGIYGGHLMREKEKRESGRAN